MEMCQVLFTKRQVRLHKSCLLTVQARVRGTCSHRSPIGLSRFRLAKRMKCQSGQSPVWRKQKVLCGRLIGILRFARTPNSQHDLVLVALRNRFSRLPGFSPDQKFRKLRFQAEAVANEADCGMASRAGRSPADTAYAGFHQKIVPK
jgi:hypothetical protein